MDHFIDTSIDPSDYDIDELREAAPDAKPFARHRGDALAPGHYRELLMLQSASGGLERPYLDDLPSTYQGELTAFEWLEFLVDAGGFKRTYDALRYYRSIGWLEDSVERGLHEYLSGLPERDPGETRPLETADHLTSLVYIGRLSNR